MKIRRIEIIGFKSFVDRTVLEFPPGVTAVVGPNGCGKSNVVDAIRWVMGEQSAKNLRGKAMEDIIFAGSESRRSLGMAEVSLVFSTEDGRVPAKYLDYSEIQVTRRLYRDGESEYYLNKAPCRLLDINELFMDTGVGARAYSIIEQGRIGMILLAKPEDRRFLIEEAAGVTKFKARKQVALKKIDATRQNLLRIGDVVAEIKRQLNSLQRQAKKAERFKLLRDELKGIEVGFAVRSYRSVSDSIRELDALHTEGSLRFATQSGQVDSLDAGLEERRIALVEEERALAAAQEAIFAAKGEYQGCENRLDFQRKELTGLERQAGRRAEELESLLAQKSEAESELKQMVAQRGQLLTEAADEEQGLAEKADALEQLLADEGEQIRRQEVVRQELIALLNRIAQLNNRHGEAGRRLTRLEERIERSAREGAELEGRLQSAASRVAEMDANLRKTAERRDRLRESIELLAGRSNELKSSLATLEEQLQAARNELSAKGARLASLEDIEARFAGYGKGVRTLFLSDDFRSRFDGIVADLLETDAEYESALEAVLGERLQYVVCNEPSDALAAIDFLREDGAGRCSFLLPGWGAGPAPAATGALRLLDVVRIVPERRPMIEPLLDDVYLAETLPSALDLSRRHPAAVFVTPAGEMAAAGGIVTGGVDEGGGQGIIHTKREIRELTVAVAGLKEAIAALDAEKVEMRADLAGAEDDLRSTRNDLQQSELQLVHCEKDLQRAREEVQRLEERAEVKALEDGQLAEERTSLRNEQSVAEAERAELESAKVVLEGDASVIQAAVVAIRADIETLREGVTALKVKAATLREKRDANERSVKRVESLIVDLAKRHAAQLDEEEKQRLDHVRLTLEIAAGEETIRQLLRKCQEAEGALAGRREKFEALEAAVQEQEAVLKGMRDRLSQEREEANRRQLKLAELRLQLQHLETSIRERHRIEISALPDDDRDGEFDEAVMQERQLELQRQVDELGEVNLMAIDEYRELEERHRFLSEQKDDLEESMQELQKAIQRINRTTRKRFLETFVQVNEKFREVFPRLFCGGQAELRLTNEEDLLETGIEIIVQPPGKKLQNVSLLSGGEKALTAVALIFSIFLVKPSPFCLLDEVDAPLDDANIGRFNEMIREMTEFSQFILITHSKTTMAVADTLYGVTMEEPGVSKVVSVRLQ